MFPLSAEEPESNRKLHHLLNVVTEALVWVIAKSGIPTQQQTTRLANLLMLLSHVRHARYGLQSVCNTCVVFITAKERWLELQSTPEGTLVLLFTSVTVRLSFLAQQNRQHTQVPAGTQWCDDIKMLS